MVLDRVLGDGFESDKDWSKKEGMVKGQWNGEVEKRMSILVSLNFSYFR